jgi:hypothetical protein
MNGGEDKRLWIIGGKSRGKGTIRKTKTEVVYNIKMDLGEIGWGCVDWICLAQNRYNWRAVVHAVINLRVP